MITAPAYQGKKVGVFGLARTGVAAVHALVASGADVWAWDDNADKRDSVKAAIKDLYAADFTELDALLLAPGVPLTHPAPHSLVVKAQASGTPLISDIDVFQSARKALPAHKTVAITGTNGKSTTTALIGHLAAEAGKPVAVGGNIGTGVLALSPLAEKGVYVFELSSFQLELTSKFRANIAVLLNVTPDHLDRHGTFEEYLAAKKRLFDMQKPGKSAAIISVDDEAGQLVAAKSEAEVVQVSTRRAVAGGVYVQDGILVDDTEGASVAVGDLRGITSLRGEHNWQNAACAYAAARQLGIKAGDIFAGLASFPGLEHRQEVVGAVSGVRFINDSKATNSDAAIRALNSFNNIHWLAGGKAKETDFTHMRGQLASVKHAYFNGAAADTLTRDLGAATAYSTHAELASAFAAACEQAVEGDNILLSPACTAFDQFADFEKRGAFFKKLVADYAASKGEAL